MRQKRNKAGKLQNYDSKGRYAKNNPIKPATNDLTRKERYMRKIKTHDYELLLRAKNSKDPMLFNVASVLISEFPGKVKKINEFLFDTKTGKPFEQDIIMERAIIEVKSGTVEKCSRQFAKQKAIASQYNKFHIVFAPNISFAREKEYTKQGICITKNIKNLVEYMKGLLK